MADTNTPNILLLLPDLNDTFNFASHVEANFTTIDALMGAVQCTSTTRPTNTFAGQIIYETDTKRYVQNTGTKGAPTWTYMSHAALACTSGALPAVAKTGDLVYCTDIGATAYYSGGAWHYSNIIAVSSATRPAGSALQIGTVQYETDTKRLAVYNGTTWDQKAFATYVCTSGTHPASPFQGLEIFETDTGQSAVYNGSGYLYALQQAAATQTLNATTASVTFSGLPAANGFLVKWSARCSDANVAEMLFLRFNGDSGSNYLWEVNQANNATVAGTSSGAAVAQIQIATTTANSATADYFATGSFVVDPGGTGQYTKANGTASAFATTTNMWSGVYGGQWLSTATVTSITLQGATGSFLAGSQFSIYALP